MFSFKSIIVSIYPKFNTTPILNIPILNFLSIKLDTIMLNIIKTIFEKMLYMDKSTKLSLDVWIKYAVKNGPKNLSITLFIALIAIIAFASDLLVFIQ